MGRFPAPSSIAAFVAKPSSISRPGRSSTSISPPTHGSGKAMDGLTDPRLSIGAQPISDAEPAGANIRYETDFLELQETVAQMESKGPLAVDWRDVAAKGCAILQSRSKDLLVASYVALALSRTEGYRGLSIGLGITADMAAAFWTEMQPPVARERARVQMMEWLVQRVVPIFAEQPPSEADGP